MLTTVPPLAIDARQVARRFGARWILRGATVQLAQGKVLGLIGQNGSGKSTFLRILCTLLRPTAGSATVFGADVTRDADAVRASTAFFSPIAGAYEDLTALENVRFAATMLRRDLPAAEAALDRVGLSHVAHERVRGFSSGMLRRLALARLVLHQPRLLLLDEPYNNLDADGIALLNAVVRDSIGRGGAAVIVVHDLASATPVVDTWMTLAGGRLEASAAPLPRAVTVSVPTRSVLGLVH